MQSPLACLTPSVSQMVCSPPHVNHAAFVSIPCNPSRLHSHSLSSNKTFASKWEKRNNTRLLPVTHHRYPVDRRHRRQCANRHRLQIVACSAERNTEDTLDNGGDVKDDNSMSSSSSESHSISGIELLRNDIDRVTSYFARIFEQRNDRGLQSKTAQLKDKDRDRGKKIETIERDASDETSRSQTLLTFLTVRKGRLQSIASVKDPYEPLSATGKSVARRFSQLRGSVDRAFDSLFLRVRTVVRTALTVSASFVSISVAKRIESSSTSTKTKDGWTMLQSFTSQDNQRLSSSASFTPSKKTTVQLSDKYVAVIRKGTMLAVSAVTKTVPKVWEMSTRLQMLPQGREGGPLVVAGRVGVGLGVGIGLSMGVGMSLAPAVASTMVAGTTIALTSLGLLEKARFATWMRKPLLSIARKLRRPVVGVTRISTNTGGSSNSDDNAAKRMKRSSLLPCTQRGVEKRYSTPSSSTEWRKRGKHNSTAMYYGRNELKGLGRSRQDTAWPGSGRRRGRGAHDGKGIDDDKSRGARNWGSRINNSNNQSSNSMSSNNNSNNDNDSHARRKEVDVDIDAYAVSSWTRPRIMGVPVVGAVLTLLDWMAYAVERVAFRSLDRLGVLKEARVDRAVNGGWSILESFDGVDVRRTMSGQQQQ